MSIGMLIGHSLTESAYTERARRQAEEQRRINAAWEALEAEHQAAGPFWDPRYRLGIKAGRRYERQMQRYIWQMSITDEEDDED
jgi:hypothetical protein